MANHVKLQPKKSSSKKHRWILLAAALLFTLLVSATWYMWPETVDPRVTQIKQIQKEADQLEGIAKFAKFGEAFEIAKQLPPQQQEQLMMDAMIRKSKEERKRMNEYISLSPDEKIRRLDKEIDKQLEWEKARAEGKGFGGLMNFFGSNKGAQPTVPGVQPNGQPGSPAAAAPGAQTGAAAAPGQPNQPANGPPGMFGLNGKAPTQEQKDNFRSNLLNNTTPEMRGQRDAYMTDMKNRRETRGLPTQNRGGPF